MPENKGSLASERGPKIAQLLVNFGGRRYRARHFFAQQRPIASSEAVDNRFDCPKA